MDARKVTETLVEDVRPGMVRAWNEGTSTVEAITPDGRNWVRIKYRSNTRQKTPRQDGSYFNTVSVRARRGTYLPICEGTREQWLTERD